MTLCHGVVHNKSHTLLCTLNKIRSACIFCSCLSGDKERKMRWASFSNLKQRGGCGSNGIIHCKIAHSCETPFFSLSYRIIRNDLRNAFTQAFIFGLLVLISIDSKESMKNL